MRRPVKRVGGVALPLFAAFALACGKVEAPAEPAPHAEPAGTRASDAPPNLLLITLDTTRADALGAYGQKRGTTPNIDRAAARGVLFEDVTTSNPETLPAHSTIFTGKLPYAHGVRSNSGYVLSERNVTLAEVLRDRGYRTGAEVAAPVLRRDTQVTQGFEHYRGAESEDVTLKVIHYHDERGEAQESTRPMRVGADIARRGIEFLQADDGRPFFLWLHFFDAHDPYSAPAAFNEKIPDSPYHAEVANEDFQVGLVLLELKRLGLADDTLVVITADHGEGLFEHGEPSHSFFVYDSVFRVPLVLEGLPGLPEHTRIAAPVRTVDIAPTLLDLLGLPPLEDVQGVTLAPLVRGETKDLALTIYGEATRFTATFGLPLLRFVREGPWKYIHKVHPELYDLAHDPGELQNLATRDPERAAGLEASLERLLANAPPPPDDAQAKMDEHTAAQLIALGYVARAPTFEVRDDPESLALYGDDPAGKKDDIQVVSEAMGLVGRNDFAAALTSLEPLRARNPGNAFVMDLFAQALLGVGRSSEGVALLQEIVAKKPDDVEAGYELAKALAKTGSDDEAIERFTTLLEREPCDVRFRTAQGDLLRRTRRDAALLAMLADGVERCPDHLDGWNNYAWALATLPEDELRDGAKAVGLAKEAIGKLPEPSPAFRDTLAAALAETGDFEGAVRVGSETLEAARAANLPGEILAQLEAHLQSYRAGRPIRDPSVAVP